MRRTCRPFQRLVNHSTRTSLSLSSPPNFHWFNIPLSPFQQPTDRFTWSEPTLISFSSRRLSCLVSHFFPPLHSHPLSLLPSPLFIQRDCHVLHFSCDGLTARFDFTPIHPYTLHIRSGMTFPTSFHNKHTSKVLSDLPEQFHMLFEQFRKSIALVQLTAEEVSGPWIRFHPILYVNWWLVSGYWLRLLCVYITIVKVYILVCVNVGVCLSLYLSLFWSMFRCVEWH